MRIWDVVIACKEEVKEKDVMKLRNSWIACKEEAEKEDAMKLRNSWKEKWRVHKQS